MKFASDLWFSFAFEIEISSDVCLRVQTQRQIPQLRAPSCLQSDSHCVFVRSSQGCVPRSAWSQVPKVFVCCCSDFKFDTGLSPQVLCCKPNTCSNDGSFDTGRCLREKVCSKFRFLLPYIGFSAPRRQLVLGGQDLEDRSVTQHLDTFHGKTQ